MAQINQHYLKLQAGYLFPEIARRVSDFSQKNPEASIIRMGIGDVVLPLPDAVRAAMKAAVDEMGDITTFKGYPPGQGYGFLRDAIASQYKSRGIEIDTGEIFVSDGSKCDSGSIQEIFSEKSVVAVSDPVYPVYVDTNVMAGRTGEADKDGRYAGMVFMPSLEKNQFEPSIPNRHVDLIYLCSPNNPTGTVISRQGLARWIDFAKQENAVILFDSAYESFIQDKNAVRSIFEIPGARDVAIEFRSFSKQAGFTGIRCAYTVIPKQLMRPDNSGNNVSIHQLWNRRQNTKFNGVSYPVQKGAAAVFSPEGISQTNALVSYYMDNARHIRQRLADAGYSVFGGENAPYIWAKTLNGMNSWECFDAFLNQAHVVITPGSGFGACGEGYFRISAFALKEDVETALERIQNKLAV